MVTKTSASKVRPRTLVLVPGADWVYLIAAGLRDRAGCGGQVSAVIA
jgi:hypothetical protein